MKAKWIGTVVAILLLAVFVAACRSSGETATLEGATWALVSYADSDGATVDALADVTVDAIFKDGRVAGMSGCNTYSADYAVEGSNLTISDALNTLMACEQPIMDQEAAFLAGLQKTAAFEIAGDTLALNDSAGATLLTFAAQT